jgi:hypothetical protein
MFIKLLVVVHVKSLPGRGGFSVRCTRADPAASLDSDDAAHDILLDALVRDLHTLGFHQLVQELLLNLVHLGH